MAEARAAGPPDRARLAAEDAGPPSSRHAVREPLLGRLALLLGQLPGRDRGVDPRLRRTLDRGVELIAGDVQPLGDVVEEGLLFGGVVGGLLRDLRRMPAAAAYAPPDPARTARPAAPTASLRLAEMDMRPSQPPVRKRNVRTRIAFTPADGPVAQRLGPLRGNTPISASRSSSPRPTANAHRSTRGRARPGRRRTRVRGSRSFHRGSRGRGHGWIGSSPSGRRYVVPPAAGRARAVVPATRFEVIASPVTGDPFDDQVHSRDSMVVAASERADFGGAMSAGFLVVAQAGGQRTTSAHVRAEQCGAVQRPKRRRTPDHRR